MLPSILFPEHMRIGVIPFWIVFKELREGGHGITLDFDVICTVFKESLSVLR
jgi:hypothetical protein